MYTSICHSHVHYTYMAAWDCTSIPVVHVHAFICLLMIVYAGDSVRSWSPASSATNPIYVNGNSDGGITVKDNPSYVLHVYAQINPTLSTRPRPIPPGHPSTYNTSDSPSDPDYI